ncbi:5213_t:CDS:2, partial [Scutellospora calospora]
RVQNSVYSYGQGVLGLVHTFSSNLDDIREYLSSDLKNLMYKILVANKERVDTIFQEFSESNEDGALDWCKAGENTNIAESAHADTNREGIQMSLLLVIKKGKRLDECHFTTCRYQSNYNVSKTSRSSGSIARATKSIKRLENQKCKKDNPANKRSLPNSNIITTSNEELNSLDIEIAKKEKLRKLKLIDYKFQHQKEILEIKKQAKLANLHTQELANIEKKNLLGIDIDKELNN